MNNDIKAEASSAQHHPVASLKVAVLVVAILNLAYAVIEIVMALLVGSVSLFGDAVDFLEDAAVNALVFMALVLLAHDDGRKRAFWGKILALIILLPAFAAVIEIVQKGLHRAAPEAVPLLITAFGALIVNAVCAVILSRFRTSHGSLPTMAWMAARNDVIINISIIVMAVITMGLTAWNTGWAWLPDLLLGCLIVLLNVDAYKKVWRAAEEEKLAAKALQETDCD